MAGYGISVLFPDGLTTISASTPTAISVTEPTGYCAAIRRSLHRTRGTTTTAASAVTIMSHPTPQTTPMSSTRPRWSGREPALLLKDPTTPRATPNATKETRNHGRRSRAQLSRVIRRASRPSETYRHVVTGSEVGTGRG